MILEKSTKNGIAINHIINNTATKASKQQLLETAAVGYHTLIGNNQAQLGWRRGLVV